MKNSKMVLAMAAGLGALSQRVGLSQTEEQIARGKAKVRLLDEYRLIKQKKSKQPAAMRKQVVDFVESKGWHE